MCVYRGSRNNLGLRGSYGVDVCNLDSFKVRGPVNKSERMLGSDGAGVTTQEAAGSPNVYFEAGMRWEQNLPAVRDETAVRF